MRRILFAIAIILTISASSVTVSRWLYCAENVDGTKFYLDTRGIVRGEVPYIIKAWVKVEHSEVERKKMIERENTKTQKRKASKLSTSKLCYEINWKDKTLRLVEENKYDNRDSLISGAQYPYASWLNIIPDSVGEYICNAVLQVFYGYKDVYSY